jgi:GT2 family glycosyltransferase
LIEAVFSTTPDGTKVVVCDDGTPDLDPKNIPDPAILIQGQNLGVAANKNRALWGLQDCTFITILEDDLFPTEEGWFEAYEQVSKLTSNHHFCRVQNKEVTEPHADFSTYLNENGFTPVYGPSPRGDLTFITRRVLRDVGGFNSAFVGAGYAHGEWSERVAKAGLISHPLKWWDVAEARDKFEQRGDTEGGRWKLSDTELKAQLSKNRRVLKKLNKMNYLYHPLTLT